MAVHIGRGLLLSCAETLLIHVEGVGPSKSILGPTSFNIGILIFYIYLKIIDNSILFSKI